MVPDAVTGRFSLRGLTDRAAHQEEHLDVYDDHEPDPLEACARHARNFAANGQTADDVQWERISEILAAVNGRWAVTVLRHLASGTSRPADLLTAVNADPGTRLSRKMMFEVLQRLTGTGMVRRVQVSAQPRRTDYLLTEAGRAVLSEVSKLGKADSVRTQPWDEGEPPRIDTSTASSARMWDYWRGGKDHFTADREAALAVAAAMPSFPALARNARRFQADAVRRLLGQGVRQFVDIGTGLPAADSVHEVAQRSAPESRVVYVDNDPLALVHARALLRSGPLGALACVDADVRDPGKILELAGRTLDLAQPVAVLLVCVLALIPDDDDPWTATSQLMDGIGGDGYLVIAHGASDIRPAESALVAERYNRGTAVPIRLRPRAEIARFFDGLELLDPGLVPLAQWKPAGADESIPDDGLASYAGIGRRPARQRDRA